ncbi:MAG: VOC family protein [Anaerolineae bacterium]|nr:VOC family protein [Thermoflexales bacterium]MDW8407244.1 VOC family protein [Anaerolineae bacterium]
MRIEHIALQVSDPDAMAEWYVRHLGLTIVRHVGGRTRTYFLGDDGKHTLIEIYRHPDAPLPDYATMNPLLLHIAFATPNIEKSRARLIEAGCTGVGEISITPAGDRLCMLRDPWGVAIQLAQRAVPMV